MKSETTTWTTWTCAIAVAALLAAPVPARAASSQTQPSEAPASPADVRETETEQRRLANEHLRKAHAALADIAADQQPAAVQAQLSDLKRRISTLQHADDRAPAESAARTPVDTTPAAPADRQAELAAIERTFLALLGKDRTTGAPAVPDTAVGTTGVSPPQLDDTTRARLETARTHITAYAAAVGSADQSKEEADAAPATVSTPDPPGSPVPDAGDATAVTSPVDPTPTPTGTSPTDTPQIPAIGAPTDPRQEPRAAALEADKEAARQHLLAARNTLSQMTQMPEAAAITGEARAQVSLLISQFNQLIAANAGWRDALPPVKANLERLLAAEATADRPPTDPDRPEPVGTAGISALDSEIRAKLEEFRTHLEAFERAAGATTVPADRAEPVEPRPERTAAPGEVATRVSETDPTTASGSTSTGAAGADMPGPTADAIGGEPMQATEPMPREVLRHIEAIEAILVRDGPRADTAQPTAPALASEDVEEIRRHLGALRRLVESRGR